jgi:hypothetical protein
MRIYQSGNLLDGDRNFVRGGHDPGWDGFSGTYTKLTNPVSMAPVQTDTAQDAYTKVLAGAGAFLWARDSVDKALMSEVVNFGGKIINSQQEVGGYPVLPSLTRPANWDTDLDGMPDWWEMEHGLNPGTKDNNGLNPDGYTNLEHYLHYAAAPEPSTAALLSLGVVGWAVWRVRQRSRRADA